MRTLPNSIIGLIEELERQYPQRCIRPDETLAEAHHHAGRAALVLELRQRYDAETRRESARLPPVL